MSLEFLWSYRVYICVSFSPRYNNYMGLLMDTHNIYKTTITITVCSFVVVIRISLLSSRVSGRFDRVKRSPLSYWTLHRERKTVYIVFWQRLLKRQVRALVEEGAEAHIAFKTHRDCWMWCLLMIWILVREMNG